MPDWQIQLGEIISEFVWSVGHGEAREIACYGPRGESKTIGALAAMVVHSMEHERTGQIVDDNGQIYKLNLPVPWMGITDFHRSHKDKTVPSLMKVFWQGAWQTYDEDHLAVFKTDKERVHLNLFGVEDQGAIDRVRRETCGLWAEEPAPATTGPGINETTWLTALTSQRIPTHARVAMLTTNYPDEDSWVWTRFNPALNATSGFNLEDHTKMWFRVPKGDNPYISDKAREEWAHALKDRPDLARRLVHGLPGSVALGPQVAIGFREDRHTARDRIYPAKGEMLYFGQDGGLNPCTIIGQPVHGFNRIYAALPMDRGGMRQQYEQNVVPWLREYAPWVLRDKTLIEGCYDPSLPDDESDSDRNPIDVIEELIGGSWHPGPVDWESRKGPMLASFHRTINLEPELQIDPVDGKPLIQALASRWYYGVDRMGRIMSDKPKQNHPFDDLGQAYCYYLCAMLPEIMKKKPRQVKVETSFAVSETRDYDVPNVDTDFNVNEVER